MQGPVRPRAQKDIDARERSGAEKRSDRDQSRRLRRITRVERERPEPSTIWRGAGGVFFSITAGATLTAIAASEGSVPEVPLSWVVAAASAALAVVCVLAHWDVNRGRRTKRTEILDEVEDEN